MGPLNIDIWRQHIDNVPQDEISRYVAVSIFWHTPSAKPRTNQLGSVKTPILSVVGIDNYSVKMKEYVLCLFPSLCGKQHTPDTISIKVEEDIGGGLPATG